jgi:hypothetical protein
MPDYPEGPFDPQIKEPFEAPIKIPVALIGNPDRTGTVAEVIDGRRGVYGDPTEMFSRAAEIWSGITGHHITATDVPLMLIGYKVLRTQHTPDYSDNSDDIEGYLDIFRELVGEDMIHARSVPEYLEKKAAQ